MLGRRSSSNTNIGGGEQAYCASLVKPGVLGMFMVAHFTIEYRYVLQ